MKDQDLPASRELDARVHELLFRDEPPDVEVPYYSSDLGAAWQVAETLRALGYLVDVGYDAIGSCVTRTSPIDPPREVFGETPPLALCRAAVGVVADGDLDGRE